VDRSRSLNYASLLLLLQIALVLTAPSLGHVADRFSPIMQCQHGKLESLNHHRYASTRRNIIKPLSSNLALFTDSSCGVESWCTTNAMQGIFVLRSWSVIQNGIASLKTVQFFHVESCASRISALTTRSSYSTAFLSS